ncbi:MAG: response regulator [Pseudomonadota bacterium]
MIHTEASVSSENASLGGTADKRQSGMLTWLPAAMVVGGIMIVAGGCWLLAGADLLSGRFFLPLVCGLLGLTWLRREQKFRQLKDRLRHIQWEALQTEKKSQAATELLEREIADHHRTLERLRTSERNYRNVFENTGTATIIIEPDMTISRVNLKFVEMTGFQREEIEHRKRLPDFVSTETADSLSAYFKGRLADADLPTEIEFTLNDRSKKAKQIVVQVGRIPGTRTFVASLSDITDRINGEKERHLLEAQLHQAQRMEAIGTLAGGIAHDFNNLMMGMLGNLSLAMAELPDDHPGTAKLKNVESLIQSGAKLTGQLLGYARKGQFEIHRIDLNEVIRKTGETIGRTMKGVAIELDLNPEIESVHADGGQMEQVLVNLMVNAADAMPNGGSLYLGSDVVSHRDISGKQYTPKPGRYIRLTVRDTGIGMDRRTLTRIFDPFFTTKEMGRGTGLGLASAYGIVKGHGGYIDAESIVGEGATFSIYLPAAGPLPSVAVAPTGEWAGGSETILVVDDEPMVNDVTTRMLVAAGYRTLSAQNGHEALDIYREKAGDINLVIMDMVMPGLSGEALFEKLLKIDPQVNVLVSSGYSMDSKSEKLLHNGARGFIQKPFSMSTLGKRIRDIIDTCSIAA